MVWHDCKTDPPKKSGFYLLIYNYNDGYGWEKTFDRASYSSTFSDWQIFELEANAIKWAEVDLSEVE